METFESPVYTFEPHSSPLESNPWLKWAAIIGVWAFIGVVYTAPIYIEVRSEGMVHSAVRVFTWGILSWVAWAPLEPAIVWFARHFSLVGGAWKRSLPVHIPAFLISSAVHSAAAVAIVLTVKPWDKMGTTAFWPRFLSRMQSSFAGDLLVYGGIVGVCYAIDYYRKYQERHSWRHS